MNHTISAGCKRHRGSELALTSTLSVKKIILDEDMIFSNTTNLDLHDLIMYLVKFFFGPMDYIRIPTGEVARCTRGV